MIYEDQLQTIGCHIRKMKEDAWLDTENDKDVFDEYIREHFDAINAKVNATKGILPKS